MVRPAPDLLARPAVCGHPTGMILTRARTLLRPCFARLLAALVGEPDGFAAGAFHARPFRRWSKPRRARKLTLVRQSGSGPCCREYFSLARHDARAPAQRAGLPRRGRSREAWRGVMPEGCQRKHRSEQPDGAPILRSDNKSENIIALRRNCRAAMVGVVTCRFRVRRARNLI